MVLIVGSAAFDHLHHNLFPLEDVLRAAVAGADFLEDQIAGTAVAPAGVEDDLTRLPLLELPADWRS